MNLQKKITMTQVYNEFKDYEKIFKFKIFKVMKLAFKIIFSQLLLRIIFDDRFWRSHIEILYLSTQLNTKVIMKNNQF